LGLVGGGAGGAVLRVDNYFMTFIMFCIYHTFVLKYKMKSVWKESGDC